MNPSRIFILRPIATSLAMLAILLSGLIAYRMLPVSALPEEPRDGVGTPVADRAGDGSDV